MALVRLVLLIGWFLHREMRAADLKLTVMNQFLSPWVLAAASSRRRGGGLVVSSAGGGEAVKGEARGGAAVLASARFGFGPCWNHIRRFSSAAARSAWGARAAGSRCRTPPDWEPTDRPYDTESYGHDPSYSYTNIYRFCGQYFDVSRIGDEEKIDSALAECDVLVIKTRPKPMRPRRFSRSTGLLKTAAGCC